jgi:hypothetical protein
LKNLQRVLKIFSLNARSAGASSRALEEHIAVFNIPSLVGLNEEASTWIVVKCIHRKEIGIWAAASSLAPHEKLV